MTGNGDEEGERTQRGIQSIEVGGQLLHALVHHGRPMALKDLAREAEMSAAKAHPYLVSFGRLGLIEQDRASGHYALGPLALQLGLISLQQANPVQIATPLIAELAQQIGQTVAIAVWGARGATIVRIAESPAGLLALDDVLTRFAAIDPRKAELVSLRFFAGLTMPEVAAALGISLATAERWWQFARAWLYAELQDEAPASRASFGRE